MNEAHIVWFSSQYITELVCIHLAHSCKTSLVRYKIVTKFIEPSMEDFFR